MKLCPKCQKHFSDDANFCPVDAARLTPLEGKAAEADSLATRFELGSKLGGSRTGAVHKATDKTTGKACVVKLVAKEVVSLPGVAQRLERELKQLERVQSAGVAKLLASGKRGSDETWVAVELLDGAQTLAEAIGARGPIGVAQAAQLVEVIGEALIEAAQVGVVHRDLAPKNILFAGQDVKLINFSLPVPTSAKVPGVPEFVAPEQVDGRPVDQRSNLYSLGALYYYVLTGQTVVAGATDEVHKAHQTGGIKPPSSHDGITVPAAIEAVIMRALDRSPTKRFLTVRQFVDEVARVGKGEVIELNATMAMGKVGKPKAELVSTLLGVRSGPGAPIATAPTVQPAALAMTNASPPPAAAAQVAAAVMAAPAAPAVRSTAIGVAQAAPAVAVAAQAQPQRDPSPWQPPAAAAPVEAPKPPVVAAPLVAAPVVAAPVVAAAASSAAAAPQGKRKAADEAGGQKGKFRETMWFKKGELDAQAAQAAAEERARTGKDVATDKADSLPIDERYKDDGSITRSDKEKYSLRTGSTQAMQAVRQPKPSMSGKVSEDALIGEMKGGRTMVFVAIGVGVVLLVLVIVMLTR